MTKKGYNAGSHRQLSANRFATVRRMFSDGPGIPGRETGNPSAATPFAPTIPVALTGATDDNRASIMPCSITKHYN